MKRLLLNFIFLIGFVFHPSYIMGSESNKKYFDTDIEQKALLESLRYIVDHYKDCTIHVSNHLDDLDWLMWESYVNAEQKSQIQEYFLANFDEYIEPVWCQALSDNIPDNLNGLDSYDYELIFDQPLANMITCVLVQWRKNNQFPFFGKGDCYLFIYNKDGTIEEVFREVVYFN